MFSTGREKRDFKLRKGYNIISESDRSEFSDFPNPQKLKNNSILLKPTNYFTFHHKASYWDLLCTV